MDEEEKREKQPVNNNMQVQELERHALARIRNDHPQREKGKSTE